MAGLPPKLTRKLMAQREAFAAQAVTETRAVVVKHRGREISARVPVTVYPPMGKPADRMVMPTSWRGAEPKADN